MHPSHLLANHRQGGFHVNARDSLTIGWRYSIPFSVDSLESIYAGWTV
ncbi:MAG: hypothetical protein M3072_05190 [Candidatus Dormibacteraeota bacterium]|nr:hypothetical protein [Candidatus Dormibacteraeota bacterium]